MTSSRSQRSHLMRAPSGGSAAVDGWRRQLEALGLSPYEARVLLALLQMGSADTARLARVSGVPRTSTYQVLEQLFAKGLVERLPGPGAAVWACGGRDVVFDRLDAALDDHVRQQRDRTTMLRRALAEAEAAAETTTTEDLAPAAPFLQFARTAKEAHETYDRMVATASTEVLVFNRPPYASDSDAPRRTSGFVGPVDVNPLILAAIERGVRFRVLYERLQWSDPRAKAFRLAMAVYHDAGVEARLVDDLPVKLAVADRRVAQLGMVDPAQDIGFAFTILVEHPGLAALQADAFEHLWASGRALGR